MRRKGLLPMILGYGEGDAKPRPPREWFDVWIRCTDREEDRAWRDETGAPWSFNYKVKAKTAEEAIPKAWEEFRRTDLPAERYSVDHVEREMI